MIGSRDLLPDGWQPPLKGSIIARRPWHKNALELNARRGLFFTNRNPATFMMSFARFHTIFEVLIDTQFNCLVSLINVAAKKVSCSYNTEHLILVYHIECTPPKPGVSSGGRCPFQVRRSL